MSQLISVTVLTPNGRRQTVKVSSNSTILQILEDVCAKHGFDPLEYDIRHHNRILDTTQTVQYSRLPNNAQVEMVKAKTIRKEAEVVISLQLESGDRLTDTFLPTDALWDVVTKLHPPLEKDKQPSMQYMRQEIRGEDSLKNTSLRSLGLTSGRALFRFTNRPAAEGSVAPANTPGPSSSAAKPQRTSPAPSHPPLASPSTSPPKAFSVPPQRAFASTSQSPPPQRSSPPPQRSSPPPQRSSPSSPPRSLTSKADSLKPSVESSVGNPCPHIPESKNVGCFGIAGSSQASSPSKAQSSLEQKILAEIRERKGLKKNTEPFGTQKIKSTINKLSDSSTSKTSVAMLDSLKTMKSNEPSKKTLHQLSSAVTALNIPEEPSSTSLLGTVERNPMLYSRMMQRHVSSEELPDEFFELTIDDVKYLYRDMKSRLSNIDEMPLQTSALKKLEESKKVLNQLHKYKRAVIRVEFPDQTVLQGTFSSVETVETVYEFVREYLEDPSLPFYLYTTPPKSILPLAAKLIEVDCVPCALLHIGVHGAGQEQVSFLKQKVLSNLTSLENASMAAFQAQRPPAVEGAPGASASRSDKQKEPAKEGQEKEQSAKVAGNPNGKVPKWFKLAPK